MREEGAINLGGGGGGGGGVLYALINDKPHPPHLGWGGGCVGLRSYNLCPMVGESPIDTN